MQAPFLPCSIALASAVCAICASAICLDYRTCIMLKIFDDSTCMCNEHVHLIPNICKGMCADRWVSNEQVCYKTKRRMLPVWLEILKCKSSEETLVSGSRLMNWLRNLHVGRWAVNSKNTTTYNFTAQCCSHCLKASYFVEVKRKTAVASSLNMGREVNSSCMIPRVEEEENLGPMFASHQTVKNCESAISFAPMLPFSMIQCTSPHPVLI